MTRPPQNRPLNRDRVQAAFRRGLGSYHDAARAQRQIARHLVALAQAAGLPTRLDRVFEFGAGTGHLTQALLARGWIGHLVLNDLVAEVAPALVARAVAGADHVVFHPGPIETLALPQDLDLVASSSTLQWVAEPRPVLARLVAALRPGGMLAVSGFGPAQYRELRALGSQAAAPGYLAAAEWPGLLPADLTVLALEQAPLVLRFADTREILRHLRATGVNGQARAGWTRADLARFEQEYRARFADADGQLPLTYDPVWLVARKAG